MDLKKIKDAIISDNENKKFSKKGWKPIYTAHRGARVLIIGQAPGKVAQESGIPWNDLSGDNLRDWLGISPEDFYDQRKFALVPMDFYFPGSKGRGDLPPRKGFAEKWHPLIMKQMPNIKLTLLVGKYSQELYLGNNKKQTLTETVKAYKEYLPKYIALVHPSPRNNIWQKKNPWFKKEVIPKIRSSVRKLILH